MKNSIIQPYSFSAIQISAVKTGGIYFYVCVSLIVLVFTPSLWVCVRVCARVCVRVCMCVCCDIKSEFKELVKKTCYLCETFSELYFHYFFPNILPRIAWKSKVLLIISPSLFQTGIFDIFYNFKASLQSLIKFKATQL